MSLLPIFSRRKRQRDNKVVDVFQYSDIPPNVRVQLFININESIEAVSNYHNSAESIFGEIAKELREEIGINSLTGGYHRRASEEVENWFYNGASVERILDTLELWSMFARYVAQHSSDRRAMDAHLHREAKVNARLLEAGIGFELVDGKIVEKSSEYLHSEVVIPSLGILSEQKFENANQEFRDAHDAFRSGEFEDCLTDCLKAFESVMKVIAAERKWSVPSTANASTLIAALFDHEFVPAYMRSQFDGLRTLLQSSVPTTRNRAGGHGKGTEKRKVPRALAALQLHQTAAIILFLGTLDS